MNNEYLNEVNHTASFIEEIRIDNGALDAWKIYNIGDLRKLKYPALILFSKCIEHNNFGGCISERYLTVAYMNNCSKEIACQKEIIEEADSFYILHSYPFVEKERNRILQLFATNFNIELLKYPIRNPYDVKTK